MSEQQYSLNDLLAMKPSERKDKITDAKITKGQFCNELMSNPKFKRIPGKGLVIKRIGAMSEETFQQFILETLNRY